MPDLLRLHDARDTGRLAPPTGDQPFAELTLRQLGPVRRWLVRHPRGTDVLVAAVFAVPSLVSMLMPTAYPGLHWPLVAVSTAALLLRRRWPLLALATVLVAVVVETVVVGDPNSHETAAALLVYTVASVRRPAVAWAATLTSVGVVAGSIALWSDVTINEPGAPPVDGRVVLMAVFTVLLLIAHAIGLSVRARRQHTRALVDRANQLALERDQREQLATAAERARIAREMHDVVAHSLSVMVALADGAAASLARRPERTAAALEQLSDTGRSALADTRRILGVLRDDVTATPGGGIAPPEPTHGDLDDLVARFRDAGLGVRTVRTGGPLPDDPALRLTIYRIVQESLTNVLRYAAGASVVTVSVQREPHLVRIDVRNGAPAAAAPPRVGSGRGLIGMRERVATHGGDVAAGPTPDGGWRVRAELQIEEGPT